MRTWRTDRPVDLSVQLAVFRRGAGDPTFAGTADGGVVRAAQTPEGPGTLHLVCRGAGSAVEARAWGPGAAWLLEGVPAKMNLIPFNPFPGTGYRTSPPERVEQFRQRLLRSGLMAIPRKTRGDDIDAACGQLVGRVRDRSRRQLQRQTVPVVWRPDGQIA
jgi:hypothetical protein